MTNKSDPETATLPASSIPATSFGFFDLIVPALVPRVYSPIEPLEIAAPPLPCATKSSDQEMAKPNGPVPEGKPEISLALIVAPDVVYSPTVPA